VIKSCDPEATTGDGALIVPCGLIAWSLFNDTYAFSVNKKDVPVNKKNIAWASDKNSKFGSDVFPSNFQKGGLIGGGSLNEKLPVSAERTFEEKIDEKRTSDTAFPSELSLDDLTNDKLLFILFGLRVLLLLHGCPSLNGLSSELVMFLFFS
jgi:hypothetical protein